MELKLCCDVQAPSLLLQGTRFSGWGKHGPHLLYVDSERAYKVQQQLVLGELRVYIRPWSVRLRLMVFRQSTKCATILATCTYTSPREKGTRSRFATWQTPRRKHRKMKKVPRAGKKTGSKSVAGILGFNTNVWRLTVQRQLAHGFLS